VNIWFLSNLGDPVIAEELLEHLKTLFYAKYKQAKRTKEMAIFFRHESNGGVHCEVKVYFSPATVLLAKEFGAIPCKKPASEGLGLLVGSSESRSIYFAK